MHRPIAAFSAVALILSLLPQAASGAGIPRPYRRPAGTYTPASRAGQRTFTLPDGKRVMVGSDGAATIFEGKKVVYTGFLPQGVIPPDTPDSDAYASELDALQHQVSRLAGATPYAPGRVIVVFRSGVTIPRDHLVISSQDRTAMSALGAATPAYTNDVRVNQVLTTAGVVKADRLFASQSRAALATLRSQAQARLNKPLLNIENAFRLTISQGSVDAAVAALRALPSVAYASADWSVGPMLPAPRAIPEVERRALRAVNVARVRESAALRTQAGAVTMDAASQSVPANYAVSSNFQSLLDSSGIDDIAAYSEIEEKFHQLPGTGEIITNVSSGDIFAAEDGQGSATVSNVCPAALRAFGPMTQMIGGQRYLNWPGMPLIPAYAADVDGHTDPSYVACGESDLGEVGLDFSMMAPLPDNLQRPGEQASALVGDLLGIAPGASYRLFVPATNTPSGGSFLSDIDGTLLAAAEMAPKTNVITASLGEGYDSYGFPGRYLEDDPLTETLIASIVNDMNIVVCISANDGTRLFTPTSIGISGGSAPTNVVTDLSQTTNLNDIAFSTTPSLDLDSGAIDVGGTTLNDIYARPPGDPQYAAFIDQLAYPETRYDGGQYLSSGFGTRVNISAPADGVIAINKDKDTFDGVDAFNEGGTSASAPEVAAVAAVAMQVANLTGHPFQTARAVRDFLVQTATPVLQPAVTDAPLNVGPQVNVRRAVEQLLQNAGIAVTPALGRIAVYQRRSVEPLAAFDTIFFTNTDLTNVKLAGHDYGDGRGPDGSGWTDYIDVAPDWQGMPPNAQYSLYVAGHPENVLATTPTARLLPAEILQAAGIRVPMATGATVKLTYRSMLGRRLLASGTVEINFGPTDGTSVVAAAPHVPAVVTGNSFQVGYDISKVRLMNNPMVVVTEPGRFTAATGYVLHLAYATPISSQTGTITVPISALQGSGIYGVGIMGTDPARGGQHLSNLALMRVQATNSARPAAPLIALPSTAAAPRYGHFVEMPYGGSALVSWDVSNVPNAAGAELEVSAPGPTIANIYNTFNNPNGSQPDADGVDTGSVQVIPLPGVSGTATFTAAQLGLNDTMIHTLRVIAIANGTGIGEGSDVSSIIEDGQKSSIGGILDHTTDFFSGGFAVNPNGTDGILVPVMQTSNGAYEVSLDQFDQNTHADKQVLSSLSSLGPWSLRGGGLFSSDGAFFGEAEFPNGSVVGWQYKKISSLSAAHPSPLNVALPAATDFVWETSYNPFSSTGALLYTDTNLKPGTSTLQVASINFARSSIGPPIASKIPNDYGLSVGLFAADMTLNEAFILRSANINGLSPVYLDTVNLGTGATSTVTSIAQGVGDGFAVDEGTHMAMSNSVADDSLVLYNLQTGTQQKIATPATQTAAAAGYSGRWTPYDAVFIAADPVNHLFLVYAPWGVNLAMRDFNATSPIYVFDENGNCLKTITGWSGVSQGDGSDNASQFLQVNGNTRTAYVMVGSELAIVHY